MEYCASCFGEITDKRKTTTCSHCNKIMHNTCAQHCTSCNAPLCDTCFEEHKGLCPSCITETPKIEFIRRSYVEDYRKCPYKFYLEAIKGIQLPNNCYAQVGIDLHELFDKYSQSYIDNILPIKKEWENMKENYDDKLFETKELKEKLFQRGDDSIETFVLKHNQMPLPYMTEQRMTFEVADGLPLASFTMDRINVIDGKAHLLDYKTGKVLVGKQLETDLQVPYYIYGVEQNLDYKVDSFTLLYLSENKTRVFNRVDDDKFVCQVGKRQYFISLQKTISTLHSIFNQIKQEQFNVPNKIQPYVCKICGFHKYGYCEGANLEAWKQYK